MVAPLLFMIIFLFIEFDRYVFVRQSMQEAARTGARIAILKGATEAEVQEAAAAVLTVAKVEGYTLAVTPGLTGDFEQGDLVTVALSVDYGSVSWLPSLRFLQNKTINATCSLPKEE